MNTVEVPVEQLKMAEYNPRQISDRAFAALRRSLGTFGFVEAIVANSHPDRKDIVIGGHMRLRAAIANGMTHVPVHYVELPINKEKMLNLALNAITGDWDEAKVVDMVLAAKEAGEDITLSGLEDETLRLIVEDGVMTPIDDDEPGDKAGDKKDKKGKKDHKCEKFCAVCSPEQAAEKLTPND